MKPYYVPAYDKGIKYWEVYVDVRGNPHMLKTYKHKPTPAERKADERMVLRVVKAVLDEL